MQKYRGFAEILKAARGTNALSLWVKSELRHAIDDAAPRGGSPVGAPNGVPRARASRFRHVMIEVSQRF
jgi:hypothetical protein